MKLLPGSTSSEATFATIKSWLRECDTEHHRCVQLSNRTSSHLDRTRFLEIQENRIILVESKERPHSSFYACLSHCWGSGQKIVKTTTDNIEAHSTRGIEIALLPLTFRHAIETCQRLHIALIWIDSLCIVQDSDEDWRRQSAYMADIYENARFTIAASIANNPTEGYFRETNRSCIGQPLPGHRGVWIRQDPTLQGSKHYGWPLLRRGWVFQELSLSPRTIHFLKDEVMWQCRSKREQESQANIVTSGDEIYFYPNFSFVNNEDLRRQWYDIVNAYSWRDLTFSKDRLPAIAAMATRMQDQRPGDRYLAGLWQSSLGLDLLWCNVDIKFDWTTAKRYDPITARIASCSDPARSIPSWSWASTQCGVSWASNKIVALSCIEVIDIAYTINGPDVSGDIQSARLTLRAPLICFDCMRAEPLSTKIWNQFPLRHHKLDHRHVAHCTESAATGEIVYQKLRWDNSGFGSN
jgi:hypothetical protein